MLHLNCNPFAPEICFPLYIQLWRSLHSTVLERNIYTFLFNYFCFCRCFKSELLRPCFTQWVWLKPTAEGKEVYTGLFWWGWCSLGAKIVPYVYRLFFQIYKTETVELVWCSISATACCVVSTAPINRQSCAPSCIVNRQSCTIRWL